MFIVVTQTEVACFMFKKRQKQQKTSLLYICLYNDFSFKYNLSVCQEKNTNAPTAHFHTEYLLEHFKAQRFLCVRVHFASSLDWIPIQHQLKKHLHLLQQSPT